MIGSGVFLLPASLAPFGWNAVAGWGVSILGAVSIALTMAALGRRFADSGSPADYVARAFGPVIGFLIGWSFLVGLWTSVAALAAAAASYLSVFAPALARWPALASLGFLAAVSLINLAGVRMAGRVQIATMLMKLVPLLLVILLMGLLLGREGVAAVRPFPAAGLSLPAVSAAGAITLFALLGFETVTGASDRIIRPEVNIPRAMVAGTLFVGALYLLVCSGIVLLMPEARLAASNAPFADFVEQVSTPGLAKLIAAFAAVSALGAMNGFVLMSGELPGAMARRGMLPAWAGRTGRAGTPVRALLLGGGVVALLIGSTASSTLGGLFNAMALLTTSTTLWLYLACALTALKFRIGVPTALPALAFSVWTLFGAGIGVSLLSLVLMLAGLPLYVWARSDARSGAAEKAPE